MRLRPDQVPDFPGDSDVWADHLRWMVMVMDEDDTALPFVASAYAYLLKNGRITQKQAEALDRIERRVYEGWCADELQCCMYDLAALRTEGNA